MESRCGVIVGQLPTAALVLGLLLTAPAASAQGEKALNREQIPETVMATLRARFPQAEIREWTREDEDGVALYDIEFHQRGRKFEADIKEDGTIHNWEREIAPADLPGAVKAAVESEHPGSTIGETMEITEVTDGEEVLEGYEIILETADNREIEVAVAPDGTVLEEDGEEE